MPGLPEIRTGWKVRSNDDASIGEVAEVGDDFLHVRRGLFRDDLYVPTSAIASVGDESVHLNHSEDEIAGAGWELRPSHWDEGATEELPRDEPVPGATARAHRNDAGDPREAVDDEPEPLT